MEYDGVVCYTSAAIQTNLTHVYVKVGAPPADILHSPTLTAGSTLFADLRTIPLCTYPLGGLAHELDVRTALPDWDAWGTWYNQAPQPTAFDSIDSLKVLAFLTD